MRFLSFILLFFILPLLQPLWAYHDHLTGVKIEWKAKKVKLPQNNPQVSYIALKDKDFQKSLSYTRKAMHQYPLKFFKTKLSQVFLTEQTLSNHLAFVYQNKSIWMQIKGTYGPKIEENFHISFAFLLLEQYPEIFPLQAYQEILKAEEKKLQVKGMEVEVESEEKARVDKIMALEDFAKTTPFLFMPWKRRALSVKERNLVLKKLQIAKKFYSKISKDFTPAYFRKMGI